VGQLLAAFLAAVLVGLPVMPGTSGPAGQVGSAGSSAGGAHVDRAFPVAPGVRADFADAHHDYPATDVFARCGAPARSPVDGVVLEVGRVDRWDPATDRGRQRGGKFVAIHGDDGVRYYLSHFARVRPGLRAGDRVRAGGRIARVGSTGSARGTACHVHVGLSPVCRGTGEWRVRRGVVSPYPYLRSWQDGGNRSPAAAVARWKTRHGCP
jgi:murein DD-endopeptidase MepM/ murein hydrolase activator NlpD